MINFFSLFQTRKGLLGLGLALTLLILGTFFVLRARQRTNVDPAFSKFIESYTTGIISKESPIRIRLAGDVQTSHANNEALADDIFDFSPSIKGKAYWVDARTIEFKPDTKLDPDKSYTADFKLNKVVKVPSRFDDFKFGFETIKPDFTVTFNGLQSINNTSTTKMKLDGVVETADKEDNAAIEKMLRVSYSTPVTVTWVHNSSAKSHQFTISQVLRQNNGESPLSVTWDGSGLNIDRNGTETFDVPAVGDFKVLNIRAVQEHEQYVQVMFSDPIKIGQELNGLIGINNSPNAAYAIEGSVVKVYVTDRLDGNYSVFVNEGVENISQQKITKTYSGSVYFENRLPNVTIPGKGVILPDSGKIALPFEAINLNAVDVSIIKIYENNIPQYFQNNGFDGSEDLRHVGKPVVERTIRLDADKSLNLNKKNRFMLDIDHMLRAEPGAIYRVVIGFRKEYSLYSCKTEKPAAQTQDNAETEENVVTDEEGDEDYYQRNSNANIDDDDDFWAKYDNYYPAGFKWNEKDDPCTDSYYTRERWASRNIIASNIGLITKRGNDNSMLVAVTNLLTAKPISGVDLELLDYQKQVILKTTSDGDGFASFILKRKPYLLVAKHGTERGYLKLDDGSSLPLSHFNVGGELVQSGLKGFLYGERGVWRPGDSIYMSFILEDKLKKLPTDHPVEFELHDPKGKLFRRIVQTSAVDGFYSFHTATDPSSPTGNWAVKVKVGGAVFERNIKVETIMPNRLKIGFGFGNTAELTKGSDVTGLLTAQWLFGGTAQNLKAKVDAFLSSQKTTFKNYEDYVFDDPTLPFNTQTSTIFDSRLDAEGKANVKPDINLENQAPGQLKANFLIKVFEPGGNFGIQSMNMPYNAYSGYVGIKTPKGSSYSGMLVTNQDHKIDIADVDVKGNPIEGIRNVEVELYKIQWRWWWDESGNELSNFTQDSYNKLIKTESVILSNGHGSWVLHIPDEDWGRYLIRVKDPVTGHSTGKIIYADWSNWSERLQQSNSTEAAMLSFTSDKQDYKVGDEATLTIPTMSDGRALISIENGSRILKSVWIDTKKGETRYSFKIEENMTPNVFVNVSLLQRHSQTVNDLPIRMYGAIPLMVDNPETKLQPVITMPDKIRPEAQSSVTVSEASGKEMTYTVAIVDEGLLDITNFKTPDPHSAFYAREALGVKTWDLFDYVIGAFGGGLERILSIGGDGTAGANHNVSVNRFKPVVKFMGPFKLGGGDKQTHTFTLPEYIGTVKVMVIAGHDGSYGYTDKYVAVKKPLMILATLPRVLGPSEKIKLPVTVFALENKIKTVTIQVQSNAFSNLAGDNIRTITFDKTGDKLVTFDLDVKDFVGAGKVKIIAKSNGESAAYDVDINVRNPNPPVTKVEEKDLAPGESWNQTYVPVGVNGTNKATLEVTSIPPLNLAKRLDYLIEYPYGCVEQTTSSVFPQLYLDQLLDLTSRQKAEIERNIKAAIIRLNAFQVPGGGLSYWPDGGTPNDWGTNYAGHFMLEAQAKGYSLPLGFFEQWKNYQKQKAANWAPDSRSFYGADLVQAYRLYLLAMARAPELGAMNRLREFKYLSPQARWRLAAAYKLVGQPEVGLQMIAGEPTTIAPYYADDFFYETYGSGLRDEAMILETLTLLGQQQKASAQMREVAAHFSQDEWYSTQTTAYSLIALAKYCGKNRSSAKLTFNYQSGGSKENVNSLSYLWQGPLSVKGGSLYVKNNGSNRLYVRLIQQGQPSSGEDTQTNINPDILNMRVSYTTLGGKPVEPASLPQGTDFVAKVTIENPGHRGRYTNLALTQIFPSGWEILNSRITNTEDAFAPSPSDYIDVRDDRVYTYFSLPEGKEVTYYVMLNAAYAGKYYMPAVYCEAMYNHSINALLKGQWVEVVK